MTNPPAEAWTPATDDEVVAHLHHTDRAQLMYQVREIILDRLYLQHGITIEPGDVVIDAGANVGVSAAFFAAACGAEVHSFEPVGPIYEMLCQTVRNLPTCHPHNLGFGASPHTATVVYYPRADAMSGLYADPQADRAFTRACYLNDGISPEVADARLDGLYEPEELPCEITTVSAAIDELGLGEIALLKIDVERSELDLLRGVEDRHWPAIRQVVAEVHDEGGRLDAVRQVLTDHGFTLQIDQEPSMVGTELYLLYAQRT